MLSVPRDLCVTLPAVISKDVQLAKLNSVLSVGVRSLGWSGALVLTKRVVEYITGLRLSSVVAMDFAAFGDVVDRSGGVEVDVSERIRAKFPLAGTREWTDLEFAPGTQRLAGSAALIFARLRYTDGAGAGDASRGKRQRLLLRAMLVPRRIPRLCWALLRARGSVHTIFEPRDVILLTVLAQGAQMSEIGVGELGVLRDVWLPEVGAVLAPSIGYENVAQAIRSWMSAA
jgi:LCP family protein required for cell wall assembly